MTIYQALVLGVLQGLAEFLPISSSAHLSLAPWLFGWADPGLAFDVALHLGTLAAVLWYFRSEWIALARAAMSIVRSRAVRTDEERRVVFLIVATIPGAIGGLLLESYAETVFRTPALTAGALIVMGGLLWAADRFAANDRPLGRMSWRDALLIGLAQIAALVPGVSRSGSTMTAGRALRFDRQSAAIFSFLMSMPITAAAAVLKVPEAVRESGLSAPLVVGVLAAGISSWLAIAVLLRYLSRHSFGVFALYRLTLGLAVFATLYVRARG
jgi:undecaprenyl-diphosphatase